MHNSCKPIRGQPEWHKIGVLVNDRGDGIVEIERNWPEIWGRSSVDFVSKLDAESGLEHALESTISDLTAVIEELEAHRERLRGELCTIKAGHTELAVPTAKLCGETSI